MHKATKTLPFATWRQQIEADLLQNILPFWIRMKTDALFLPALDNANRPIAGKPIGLIMVARLLWTYSRAYHTYRDASYRELAEHARRVLVERFEDRARGGYYWTLETDGAPRETNKQCYGQAFCIYAFSEHFLATGEADSLRRANELFALLEAKAWEPNSGGYLETFEADWTPLEKMRLGPEDLDAPKTMNNHLHMIEAYANLLRARPDPEVKESCRRLLRVIADRILLPDAPRFGLFYDYSWNLLDPVISPGHDIEGSWLLWEAAEIIGDADLETEFKQRALAMAELVLQTGLGADGGVRDEFHPGHPPEETRTWWPQAEGMVGFLNAYELAGDARYLDAASRLWNLIATEIIDRENGDWLWGRLADGSPMPKEKAGPWKSSYHNGRAALEMIARIDKLQESAR